LAFLNVSVFGHQAALLITVSFNKIPVFGDVSQVPDSSLFSHFDPLVQTQLLKKKILVFSGNSKVFTMLSKNKNRHSTLEGKKG
jgi:hypothetical protein